MASAWICDRCGQVYKCATNENVEYTLFSTNKNDNPLYGYEFRGYIVGEPLDLCDKCLFDLKMWFESGRSEQS